MLHLGVAVVGWVILSSLMALYTDASYPFWDGAIAALSVLAIFSNRNDVVPCLDHGTHFAALLGIRNFQTEPAKLVEPWIPWRFARSGRAV